MNYPQNVLFSIKSANNQLRRLMHGNHAAHRSGMTGMQHAVIGFLGDHVGTRDIFQRDIESFFNVRRSTATGILQLMERNGFIRREPVGYDARLKKLVLTEKAFEIRYQVMMDLTEMEEHVTRGISHSELEVFFQVMDKISRNIQDAVPKDQNCSCKQTNIISEESHL